MLSGASRLKLHWDLINLCKVVQGVLRQHCRRVFPVQFCPKSIKTRIQNEKKKRKKIIIKIK